MNLQKEEKKLTNKSYWSSGYHKNINNKQNTKRDRINNLIEKYLPTAKYDKEAIEIGCYPGGYLKFIEKMGYRINGIDFVDNVIDMKNSFIENGLHTTEIIKADFTEYQFNRKYDVVMSFGFIEHFENYQEMIERHCNMVADNGYLFITVPSYKKGFNNFYLKIRGMQEKFTTHNLESMNPRIWNELLVENNFKILFCGYFGTPIIPYIGKCWWKRILSWILYITFGIIRWITHPLEYKYGNYSAYVGIVGVKAT